MEFRTEKDDLLILYREEMLYMPELEINQIKEKFISVLSPLKIHLFGSYANGTASDDSDFDFYIIDKLPDAYRAIILSSVDTINKYSRMPLMLLKAEERLGGEEAMDKVLKQLYEKGDGFGVAEKGVTFQDFLDISGLSEEDMKIE